MAARKHGLSGTPIYRVWRDMMRRCHDANHGSYSNYGARGIAVCDRWKDVVQFAEDMGAPPPGLSIERIDVNSGYSPDNCRWATEFEQRRNTRRNHRVEVGGERLCITDAAKMLGIKAPTLRKRIQRGWPISAAISTNTRKGFRLQGRAERN